MSAWQKITVLILLCAVVVVFWALFQIVQSTTGTPDGSPTQMVLHTPTSTATGTGTAVTPPTGAPESSSTPSPTETETNTWTPTSKPTDTTTSTAVPPTNTPRPSPTATPNPTVTHTPVPQPTVPAEVSAYLKDFASLVTSVDEMGLLESSSSADQSTADRLRGIYSGLHEMAVPDGAEEMHLAFITVVSVLEEKCLCHVFADAHASDAQGQHYRECESNATATAGDLWTNRFVPARDAFLKQYSLTARQAGFPS
jgi:hypothetical protein